MSFAIATALDPATRHTFGRLALPARHSAAIILATMALAFTVNTATAKSTVLSATVGQVRSACAKAGGNFANSDGGYGCVKANCNGQGGTCSVQCNNAGQCLGTTPARVFTDGSPAQILSGGLGKAQTAEGKSGAPAKTGILDTGILGGGPGLGGGQGPAAAGSPVAPSAPAASGPIIR
jgi:hypothetical protein